MLSDTPLNPRQYLSPSKTVIKHHDKAILKKSQRKNRYLFSCPGLLAPIGGAKLGELKDLGTKNPVLYLDFPQGRMKLFGTIVYPKNRYLTLQFPRGGKNVMCKDCFDNMTKQSFGCISKDCKKSQTDELDCQHISTCLADMVGLIRSIFKSVNYTSITKEELVYKIIVNNFNIVEKREAEERINHLGKLVPDRISWEIAPSGDIRSMSSRNQPSASRMATDHR